MKNYLIDTHAHINMLNSPEKAVETALEYGVKKIIVPTASAGDLRIVCEMTQKFPNVYALLGVHPSELDDWSDKILDEIRVLSKNKKVVGIGEIGLDYYYGKDNIEKQKEVFIKQIKLANELELPIVIHDREAHKDTFDIVKEYNKNSTILLHCYSGSLEFAKECMKEDWYFALGGIVTFKNAVKMKAAGADIFVAGTSSVFAKEMLLSDGIAKMRDILK